MEGNGIPARRLPMRLAVRIGVVVAMALLVACGSGSAGATRSGPRARRPAALATAAGARARAGDWTVFGYDAAHSGAASPSGITPANVGQLEVRKVALDTVVDSAAIELQGIAVGGRARDVIVVTTIHGETLAIDAATGEKLWDFHPRGANTTVTNATPVADPGRRFVYSASPNGVIHKLNLATGRQVWGRPITYDYTHEKIASALTVYGRYVIAATGGYYGDAPPYEGHVTAIDRSSGRLAHVWNTECSSRHRLFAPPSCPVTSTFGGDAIWARAGAVIEPGGRILVATGNGPFNGHSTWGDSVLELTANASRLLHNWTPVDQAVLDRTDNDLGSTAPALLPRYHGRRLAVQGGKDGKLRLLDLGRLDGTRGPAGPRLGGELQTISSPASDLVYTAPAVWTDRGRTYVFVGDNSATAAFELAGGRKRPRLHAVWSVASGSTSPVVSGGLLYDYNTGGQLIIRRPTTGAVVRSLPLAAGHWNSPIVVGGRIIEPTGDYHVGGPSTLYIFHLPGR